MPQTGVKALVREKLINGHWQLNDDLGRKCPEVQRPSWASSNPLKTVQTHSYSTSNTGADAHQTGNQVQKLLIKLPNQQFKCSI